MKVCTLRGVPMSTLEPTRSFERRLSRLKDTTTPRPLKAFRSPHDWLLELSRGGLCGSRGILGASWGHLGASWALLGDLKAVLGSHGTVLDRGWGRLGALLGLLGAISGPSWALHGAS